MKLTKSAVMAQLCDCGKVILDDVKDSTHVCMNGEGFNGIWDGIRGTHITFDNEKKWCSIDCLVDAIEGYDYDAK